MDGRELLAKAHDVLEEGWCSHALVDDRGRHCALGAIGHARWGAEYDRGAKHGYDTLYADEACREAIELLHRELRSNKRLKVDLAYDEDFWRTWGEGKADPAREAQAMGGDIVEFNDESRGKTRVVNAFRRASGKVVEKVRQLRQPEIRVEYVPAKEEVEDVQRDAVH